MEGSHAPKETKKASDGKGGSALGARTQVGLRTAAGSCANQGARLVGPTWIKLHRIPSIYLEGFLVFIADNDAF